MVRVRVRVRVRDSLCVKVGGGMRYLVRVSVEDISAKAQASSVSPLKNSCYLVGILCLISPTIPVFK